MAGRACRGPRGDLAAAMALSLRAKIGLAIVSIVALLVYLVILDYGINAGRIHYGVKVADIDVGGLTQEEARELLQQREEQLRDQPVLVTREGLTCHFEPDEIDWRGRPFVTSVAAYRIGRGDSRIAALRARAKAWLSGARVNWADRVDGAALSRILDLCERNARGVGYEIRRYRLRQRMRAAITQWPREPVTIPIEG